MPRELSQWQASVPSPYGDQDAVASAGEDEDRGSGVLAVGGRDRRSGWGW